MRGACGARAGRVRGACGARAGRVRGACGARAGRARGARGARAGRVRGARTTVAPTARPCVELQAGTDKPVGFRSMTIDATDASFGNDVLARSDTVPVIVDLWAPWCGPCKTLSPIIERVVEATGGAVELVKVNVDENPRISQSFQVQSIPTVFAIKNRQVVDQFIGALGEAAVREFVDRLLPVASEVEELISVGDEASLRRALELEPDLPDAVVGLAEILVGRGEPENALSLLSKIPEAGEARRVAALARLAIAGTPVSLNGQGEAGGVELEEHLDALLGRVKTDDEARQELVDLLETMDPSDPRRERYRRALASRLF